MIEPMWTENYEDGTYTATVRCACGAVVSATVDGADLFKYRQGAYVQDAFPYLSADAREALFISGICGTCWDNLLGEDEHECYCTETPDGFGCPRCIYG